MKRITGILLLACISVSLMNCRELKEYKKRVAAIEIENVDLQRVADGEYIGFYDAILVKVTVKVVVKNHKIETIELLQHDNGRGADAEIIPENVVKAQSLQVDTVSGATASSKVILEAIELALKEGIPGELND